MRFLSAAALTEAMEFVLRKVDTKLSVSFLASNKSFDCVDHNVIPNKTGIRGVILHWFNTYILDRKQFMEIIQHRNDASTKMKSSTTILEGVPQGSVLGLLDVFTLHE